MDLMDMPVQEPEKDIDILLIGNSGSGKSATGNSILDQQVFDSKGGWQSVTRKRHSGLTFINGRVVTVVDTPGLNDTELRTKREKVDLVIDEMTRALIQFPNGFHAIVLVIPYNQRVDEEEKQTLQMIVGLLGSAAIEDHGILVISHGDAFKRDYSGRRLDDIASVMKELPSKYQWISDLFKKRCVLFDNITRDKGEEKRQRQKLIDFIDGLETTSRYIPNICQCSVDRRSTVLRDREVLVKYIKALKVLAIFTLNLEKAFIDDPVFTHEAANKLKKEAETIVEMLTKDKVFAGRALQAFSTMVNSLNPDDDSVRDTGNEIAKTVQSLQLKIDLKLETTIQWQSLHRRLEGFFRNIPSHCNIA